MTLYRLAFIVGVFGILVFVFQLGSAVQGLLLLFIQAIGAVVSRLAMIPTIEFHGPNASLFEFGFWLVLLIGVVAVAKLIVTRRKE